MKTGKTIEQLAASLVELKNTSKDFIVPNALVTASVKADDSVALSFGDEHFTPNSWAHSQLSQYTKIPKPYYDRLIQENPVLLTQNINHAFNRQEKESRLIRTVNGGIRAVLSSRYRVLDAYDMIEAVYPLFKKYNLDVVSSEITDQRMFIKVLSPKTHALTKNDLVQYGLTISTSDVGSGSVRVEPLIYRLVCTNGLIMDTALRKYHVGKNNHEDSIQELLSDETKSVSDKAFWMSVTDVIKNSLDANAFEARLEKLRETTQLGITNKNLPKVVEKAMKIVGISGEAKQHSILNALASGNEGAGLTQWGLINSFTAAAKDDAFSYDDSIELERAGGAIVELSKTQWSSIAA